MDQTPAIPAGLLIEEEMKDSYLTYAMSVLVDRALPDIRDGLKPVHRRILYVMRELNLTPGAKYQKSAKIVGSCIANYHPHGDGAVYDAMVRMAQSFSLRYPLVDGQGNFGSIDGDRAAAYRYTEARMAKPAAEMLDDIQYDTVDFKDNFDSSTQEPVVLPSRLPNLLVNGSSGIAVGMATNIPPHNIGEVCQATMHLIEHPEATVTDLMRFIHAPDFPTGGLICGTGGARLAYETGRGRVVMRAKVHQEEAGGATRLVVTEIPYAIKLETITQSIDKAVRDEVVTGISNMHGGTVKEGIRLVLTLKRGEDPDVVLNQLWKHTSLQYTFGINMVALDRGRPRTVGLKRILSAWIQHRKEVIVRRTRFLLARDEARLHIVLGLLKAIDIIDEIIALIRASMSVDEARTGLIERFGFSERQAQAILDMQLRRLTSLERDRLQAEHDELCARIEDYRHILAHESRQYGIIKADLEELLQRYGDERRSQISHDATDLGMEDLIEDEECVVTITNSGYIKRLPVDTYRVQRRGGKGVSGGKLRDDDDFVSQMFLATTHQYLLFFTTSGKVYWLKVYAIPQLARTARGRALPNVLELAPGEQVTTCIPVREFSDDRYLLFATAQGQIKKTQLSAYGNPRQAGIWAIKLNDDDRLIGTAITTDGDEILLATRNGQAVRCSSDEVRAMARYTGGVAGVNLVGDDEVVSLVVRQSDTEVLTLCANGYGKRTPFDDYRLVRRGAKGVTNINTNERNGTVVASLAVSDDDALMLMSRGGMVVRTRVADIRSMGRATAGVRLIGLQDGDILIGVARSVSNGDDQDDDSDANPALESKEDQGEGSVGDTL